MWAVVAAAAAAVAAHRSFQAWAPSAAALGSTRQALAAAALGPSTHSFPLGAAVAGVQDSQQKAAVAFPRTQKGEFRDLYSALERRGAAAAAAAAWMADPIE